MTCPKCEQPTTRKIRFTMGAVKYWVCPDCAKVFLTNVRVTPRKKQR